MDCLVICGDETLIFACLGTFEEPGAGDRPPVGGAALDGRMIVASRLGDGRTGSGQIL